MSYLKHGSPSYESRSTSKPRNLLNFYFISLFFFDDLDVIFVYSDDFHSPA